MEVLTNWIHPQESIMSSMSPSYTLWHKIHYQVKYRMTINHLPLKLMMMEKTCGRLKRSYKNVQREDKAVEAP